MVDGTDIHIVHHDGGDETHEELLTIKEKEATKQQQQQQQQQQQALLPATDQQTTDNTTQTTLPINSTPNYHTNKNTPSVKLYFSWMQTKLGALRLVQFITLLVAVIIMSTMRNAVVFASIKFFWLTYSVCISVLLIVLFLQIFDLKTSLPIVLRTHLMIILSCSVAVIVLLTSSCLVIYLHSHRVRAIGAGVVGIFAALLFLLEDMYHIITFVKESSGIEIQLCAGI